MVEHEYWKVTHPQDGARFIFCWPAQSREWVESRYSGEATAMVFAAWKASIAATLQRGIKV